MKQSLSAGQAYNTEARRRKERQGSSARAKEQEDVDMEEEGEPDLGPPHLRAGAEGIEALIGDKDAPVEYNEVMNKWWQRREAEATNPYQLAMEWKCWRCRKPAKGGQVEEERAERGLCKLVLRDKGSDGGESSHGGVGRIEGRERLEHLHEGRWKGRHRLC